MTQTQQREDPQVVRARARVGIVLQDKWRLEALLGVGGMAAVYAATHRNGKRVAVKMLHQEFSNDEEVRTRFLQEGYAANAIQHDGAVSVLDDDVAADGSAFLVMELLEGETVEQRWERSDQRLALRDLLSIVDPLLEVLGAAHEKSVVHRDIKPENLFVTKAGALKVLDFGIAKVFEQRRERTTSTRVGTVMGTPAYMAPEQALAHWDEVDGRTDLWAVGATMFTMLSGRHVHDAPTSQEQMILSATTPAPLLASVVPGLPAAVVSIVDRALAFDRTKRWPDAASMREAVRVALDALGGPEFLGESGRAPTATLVSRDPGAHARAATMLDTTTTGSSAAAWTGEREGRLAEAAKLRARISELQQRQVALKKRVAEVQAKVDAGRAERQSLEQWFKRQVGTRTAAVEEARKETRRRMVALARRAVEDRSVFGPELDPTREQIAKLDRAAESAARDLDVHAAALESYDPPSRRKGVLLLGVLAVIVLALVIGPIVWRATRVIAPQ
jgi:tetrahydromethanopterin S-methyltransferase subunit B